ncbi:MAG TPA: hypothetical protein VFC19_24180 [Candidatus Limnocylindrales bacterium]|nr:hypothetical protein [Candidatus Limnocylindrales bacterium]
MSRRAVLGGAAVGVAAAGLMPAGAAYAGSGPARKRVDEDSVDAVASGLDDDLIALRRDIHLHPEIAGQEQRTAELVAERLRTAGLEVTTGVGGHGVVGVLTGAYHGRTVAYRADMDAVPPSAQMGGGPQPAHVCGHDVHTTIGVGVAQVLARCWPPQRYVEVREDIHRIALSSGEAAVNFPNDPFPAMVCPRREGNALKRYLQRTRGDDQVRSLQAAVPFNGEDFALFLNRMPGTFTFLGVRTPGAAIETSFPHLGSFTPDERAIGHGVRAMAGWLARRT